MAFDIILALGAARKQPAPCNGRLPRDLLGKPARPRVRGRLQHLGVESARDLQGLRVEFLTGLLHGLGLLGLLLYLLLGASCGALRRPASAALAIPSSELGAHASINFNITSALKLLLGC